MMKYLEATPTGNLCPVCGGPLLSTPSPVEDCPRCFLVFTPTHLSVASEYHDRIRIEAIASFGRPK